MDETVEVKETEEVEEVVSYPYAVAVRFRNAGKPYSFGTFEEGLKKGTKVVVNTVQGLEVGEVDADALSVAKYNLRMPSKPVIRVATIKDLRDFEENKVMEDQAFRICQLEIEALQLDMHLLSAWYTLDRTKVLFIYLADQRVDFRELLKKLGAKLKCRIELRQIGERDKAKMVGGIGMCGMECCCIRFKNHFDVISINMAKDQMLALNIEKLSGMCGKLMCCLKYEDDDYKKIIEGMPKLNSQVEYEGNIYRITAMNAMNGEAKLENRESVLFLGFDELREKAIPRKGVVMGPKKIAPGEEKKVIHKTVANTLSVLEKPVNKVSMELPTIILEDRKKQAKPRSLSRDVSSKPKSVSVFGGRSDKHKPASKEVNAQRAHNTNTRKIPEKPGKNNEIKSVTVRTFGKKKKTEAGA